MNILITGARGFVGKNLCAELRNIRDGKANNYVVNNDIVLFEYDINSDPSSLDYYCSKADFVFHLAGVNRPEDVSEFMTGNFGFSNILLNNLKKYNNTCPVVLSSSIHSSSETPYGRSKKAGEELFFDYSHQTGAKVLVYRFPNLFGKWCRPNYNSVIATFCYNIANDIGININDGDAMLQLAYIDDVVHELINTLSGNEHHEGNYCVVPEMYCKTVGHIADLILSFKKGRINLFVPDLGDSFIRKLYSTYLSYLPSEDFVYPLTMHTDNRGSFTEILRTETRGQFSVNISGPGIVKGEHWHHTKSEKFIVVSGCALIQMRKIGVDDNGNLYPTVEIKVSGDNLEVVDMIPGYTHNIINLSENDKLITLMWATESFDPTAPDTFSEKVGK